MTTHSPPALIAAAPALGLATRVAERLDTDLVPAAETWFASGEGKIEIQGSVRGRDVYVFQSVAAPGQPRSIYDNTMMLLHAVEAATLADARSITAVVPYYPCARQDKRKGRRREGISAGLIARCLETAGANRVVTAEVHNEAIGGMFDPVRCTFENLSPCVGLSAFIRQQGWSGDVVASPDVGGLERARSYAEALSSSLVVLNKVRDYAHPNRIVSSTLIGEVDGRDVLVVDDIIDTAGSVVAAVDQLRANGAKSVAIAAVHPVFSGPAIERLEGIARKADSEGWTFTVIGTTSVEHPDLPSWYKAYDLAPMLARVITALQGGGSVTAASQP